MMETEDQIRIKISNNQAISNFMGYTFMLSKETYLHTDNFIIKDYLNNIIESTPIHTYGSEEDTRRILLKNIFYDKCGRLSKYTHSWDALMSVVDKIGDLGVDFTIGNKKNVLDGVIYTSYSYDEKVSYYDAESRINQSCFEASYNCVSNFCKWYKHHGTITHKKYILNKNEKK